MWDVMGHLLQKQRFVHAQDGLDWVEAYDTLQRHWPHTRARHAPRLVNAAERMILRRRHRPLPPRQAFASTVDYYEALLPLFLAHKRLERTASWRYMRPLMIRVLLRGFPRRPFF